ncbi:MAG: methylglyoxal synthase [Candidatus Marinimicrobia bacterium]|nr:methylglyoxal synthase [Candidatus Neomarinimicrobiota bacterium]
MNQYKKTIALIAHNSEKIALAEWASEYKSKLKKFNLVGTQGTAKAIKNITGLTINPMGHGPDGGDVVIANQVLEDNIDILIFFIDGRTPHGHEHDIQTLVRISVIKNVPLALNRATADFIISSQLTNQSRRK